MNVEEQLALLRQKVALINERFQNGVPRTPESPVEEVRDPEDARVEQAPQRFDDVRPARYFVEDLISGQVMRTDTGEHFETEKLYERHRRHGSMDISTLQELPADLLDALSESAIPCSPPEKWAFLDTETTGLAGGAGTYAFLIGVGSIDAAGFRVRQFFMRDFGEEASLLTALTEHLSRFDVLITYNGKAYDQPLLETRYRMARMKPPFERMTHLDLLYGARRLWKLRLESCRLVTLENRILGVERQGDVPGELIPYFYFDYLRTRQAFRLVPVFHHNVIDIVSLACLTGLVPYAFRSPESIQVHHGADLIGIARWLLEAEKTEEALGLYRRAVEVGLPDAVLFRTLWDIAQIEKKLGRLEAALGVWSDLSANRNPFRVQALEELAKHYEHRERNDAMALEMTRAAIELEETPELKRREQRLRQRMEKRRNRLPGC
ncbi:MAG: ribonuclease H-like domain-containing protein [Bryobacteraceae bacterium]